MNKYIILVVSLVNVPFFPNVLNVFAFGFCLGCSFTLFVYEYAKNRV